MVYEVNERQGLAQATLCIIHCESSLFSFPLWSNFKCLPFSISESSPMNFNKSHDLTAKNFFEVFPLNK
jgi:hypothetical protein